MPAAFSSSALVKRYRTMHGNETIDNRDFLRRLLASMRAGETVGILMDTNMTPPQGVFVNFFGIPAATTTAIATFALRTGAAVLPGFLIWEESQGKHRLRFDPPVELINTGDLARDVLENTKIFNRILESYVRKYPDQWLWIHRRWKTRPEGENSIY